METHINEEVGGEFFQLPYLLGCDSYESATLNNGIPTKGDEYRWIEKM